MSSRLWMAVFVSAAGLCACSGPVAEPAAEASLTPAEQALLERIERYHQWPDEEDLPVPPDGWYKLQLDGDEIDVFRDEYGVPHIFAPSIGAAFKGQGYCLMEDRCMQVLGVREHVHGWRPWGEGEGPRIEQVRSVRMHSFTEEELQEMIDRMRPDHRRYLEAYLVGVNTYLAEHAPQVPPATLLDIATGAVHYMNMTSFRIVHEHDLYSLLAIVKTLKGEEFARNMVDECLPLNVPKAITTDHTHGKGIEPVAQVRPDPAVSVFEPERTLAFLEREMDWLDYEREIGVFHKWGSQFWAVSAERSATGNAMFFSGPMMEFFTPSRGAQIHLVAPGMNVAGICFMGVPGVVIGHNDRVAWGSTSAVVDQIDVFVEKLNPEDHTQYWYKGEWRDMDVIEFPCATVGWDGEFVVESFTLYRTVHGRVTQWDHLNHRAFAELKAHEGHQLQSYTAHIDINLARNLEDIGEALRNIATTHNFAAADVDGNIGYWLTGRIPVRAEGHDPRFPVPGTGEYDWKGTLVATDIVSVINPEEGYLQNFNGKPSAKVRGWWPEILLGYQIEKTLRENDRVSWETFVGINRKNGLNHFGGAPLMPVLLDALSDYETEDPNMRQALFLLREWDYSNVPDSPAACIFDEWMKLTMVEVLRPDLGAFVKPSLTLNDLKLFGLLVCRILDPEHAGVVVKNDYLHGRDAKTLVVACFERAMERLIASKGPHIETWTFNPGMMPMGELGWFPLRTCGTYWMALEMSDPIRHTDMLCPGQSALHASPHFKDQADLFWHWDYKKMRFAPDEFEDPPPGIARELIEGGGSGR